MRITSILVLALTIASTLSLSGCSQSTDDAKSAAGATATVNAKPIDDEQLKKRLDRVIAFTGDRILTEQNNAWQIVHGILAYEHDLKLQAGGKVVPALDYFLAGGEVNGWTLRPGDHGLEAVLEAGTMAGQGHEDQWLGYLSQIGLPPDQPIVVKGQTFKLMDLITQAQWDIYPGMEATWTLMGLTSYLPLDVRWKAKDGQEWTIDRIVAQEAAENINDSACGGSHRLYGLAMAMNQYLAQGKKPEGAWLAAEKTIKQAIADAHKYQQPNGLFSTNFFARPGSSPDIAAQMRTSGHVFEFLAMAMTDQELREPWMTHAADALCGLFEETKEMPVECAALYHGAHGLIVYRERRFGPRDKAEPTVSSEQPSNQAVAPSGESAQAR